MIPATYARGRSEVRRLLLVDPESRRHRTTTLPDLATAMRPGDVVVLNDAATWPASLHTVDGSVELRLVRRENDATFLALVFAQGDWRLRTEDRPAPPVLCEGHALTFRGGLGARVVSVSAQSRRLVRVRFDSTEDALWPSLYRAGRPIQYAYQTKPLALWDVQTSYASRPWAAEAPSAGLPLSWSLLLSLRERGVALAALTHAAGISSTGDAALDALLPLEERFDIPSATVDAIERAKRSGGRVVALGTTVVRALEGCALLHGGELRAESAWTNLRIGPGFAPRVTDGILTGMHEPTESHYQLLQAFAPRALLDEAHRSAEAAGFLTHEFGDSALILPGTIPVA